MWVWQMTKSDEPGDEWVDDPFFRAGDGSPDASAHSLTPVAFEEEAPQPVSAEWLARRALLTRRVAWAVGGLAVFALLAPFAQARRTQQGAVSSAPVVLAPAQAQLASDQSAPLAGQSLAEQSSSVSSRLAAAVSEPLSRSVSVFATAHEAAAKSAPVVATARAPLHSSRPRPVPRLAKAAVPSSVQAVAWPAPRHVAPSTPSVARFPDPS